MAYEWDPSDYARHSSAQMEWAEELIEKMELEGGECVLDVGCGDGKVTSSIAQLTPRGRVVGLDASLAMVRMAAERFAAAEPRLHFLHGDASSLPFNEAFQIVFSNSALHWIKDQRPVLEGIRQALVPGGRAYLRMGGKGAAAETVAALETLMHDPEWSDYFHDFSFPYGFYGPVEYTGWLEDAGLRPVSVELIPRTMVHTLEKFRAWVRTTKLPYTQRVPDGERDRFINAIVEQHLADHPPDASGHVSVTMNRLEVIAER